LYGLYFILFGDYIISFGDGTLKNMVFQSTFIGVIMKLLKFLKILNSLLQHPFDWTWHCVACAILVGFNLINPFAMIAVILMLEFEQASCLQRLDDVEWLKKEALTDIVAGCAGVLIGVGCRLLLL